MQDLAVLIHVHCLSFHFAVRPLVCSHFVVSHSLSFFLVLKGDCAIVDF